MITDFILAEIGRNRRRHPQAPDTAKAIVSVSDALKLDPLLPVAIAYVESGYNPRAMSPVGARGFMQLMPSTAEEWAGKLQLPYSDDRLYDPIYNCRLAINYFNALRGHYNDELAIALTAYNRGQGNVAKIVEKHGTLPPNILDYYANVVLRKYYTLAKKYAREAPPPATV